MTDITLEQRAQLAYETWRDTPADGDSAWPKWLAVAEALRLSAGADWVLVALNNGFVVRKQAPLDYLTDEANAALAWGVYRESPAPPHCAKDGSRQWFGPTPQDAVRAAFKAMGIAAAPRHETGEG